MRVAVTLEQCWHRVPGGTARAAIDQVSAIAATGEVDLVGVGAWHRSPPEPAWTPPIPVRSLPVTRLMMYEGWHRLGQPRVSLVTGKVDVIHATGVAVPPRSAPLVVTVHDLAVLHDPSTFTKRGVSFLRTAIDRTRTRADLVLCSSLATFDDCVAHGFDPDRLRLVPLGVTIEPPDPDVLSSLRHNGLERFVLWVGTREPRKNLVTLLDAFSRLDHDDVQLVLVGPEGWGPDAGERLQSLGDRVRVMGFVPTDYLPALYAAAEVVCYPSLFEGFGLPVLEAMAQGTPVVTSSGTATEELVAGGGGVAVNPRDPDAIATAISALLDDPERARQMGETGRQAAAGYTWDETARLTIDAYRELL